MASAADETGLAKVEAPTAAEVCQLYKLGKPAAECLSETITPSDFLDALSAKGLHEEALNFLAYALPVRERIYWALLCAREATPEDAKEEVKAALAAADAWVTEPGDDPRRAAMATAEAATYSQPAGCVAVAIFFSGGSIAPADCPDVDPPVGVCSKVVASSVNLGALGAGPEVDKIADRALHFVGLGIGVANEPCPWEEAEAGK